MATVLRLVTLLVLSTTLLACGDDDPHLQQATVRRWERFEATLPRPVSEANPFDPRTIAVDVELRSPRGATMEVPAFVMRDYERQLVGGFEKLRASSDLQWKVRFSLPETGVWSWRWRITTPAQVEHGSWSQLAVDEAAPGNHGFVRRSARDARFLEHDDGTSYWAIGENLSWYDGRGTFAYDDWLAKLAAQGCNYARLWMPSWAFGLEWTTRDGGGTLTSSSLGNYTDRLDRAWQLDQVIEAAQRHGIHLMLAIQYHGAFSLTSNTEWAHNPYNAVNGGPLASPRELFTDPEALELVKRRLRYIVARWGYSPHIMTWELWNEADLTEQPSAADMTAWHRDMARELRRLDPHDRLISTSTSARDQLSAVWALAEIDYTQIHYYAFEGLATDFSVLIPTLAARFRRYAKPLLLGEVGVDLRGPAETLRRDPDGDGFHDILWSGLISETFGSGMSWWWDNVIDPQDLYFHFGPLAAFTAGVDFPGEGFRFRTTLSSTPTGSSLRVFTLHGADTILVWVKNARHNWSSPDRSTISNGAVTLEDLGDTRWTTTWHDTRTGARAMAGDTVAQAGSATVSVPPFERDIALRLERVR